MQSFTAVSNIKQYIELCKPKVVMLIVFTAIVGMLLAPTELFTLSHFLFGVLGIGLAASAAAVFNHILDQRIDTNMVRTKHRPLVVGGVTNKQALALGFILSVIAMVLLLIFVNALTAWLTLGSIIGYAVIYTLLLKRATPQNIVIGGAAGAAPPVLGWVAMTGELHGFALLLFLIIFVWTPPHFWALAIFRKDDYANVDIPMLPVTHGITFTRIQILLYSVLLLLITLLPFLVGMSGIFYLIGALLLGIVFLYYAIALFTNNDPTIAMRFFGYSVFYLFALFSFLLIDHYL